MKKQLLILGLCAMALSINAQTNLIANGDFATPFDATKTSGTVNNNTELWYSVIKPASVNNGNTITPDVDADVNHGNVVKITNLNKSGVWGGCFLAKRTKTPAGIEKEVYTLSFDVKSVGGLFNTRVYIRDPKTDNVFIKINDINMDPNGPDAKKSASAYPYGPKVKDTWEHVSVDYDFKQVVDNYNSLTSVAAGVHATPITDATLQDFTVAIFCNVVGTILVDNISLVKKSSTNIANNKKDANGLIIYTNGNNVNVLNAKSAIEIYDISGKLIQKENSENFSIAQKGIYILKANNATQKLVIR
ncbi:MAG: DUF4627 domain-containing protein [Bacteroides sp.]